MTRNASGLVLFAALIAFATPAMSQQYFLYSPQMVGSDVKSERLDGGILVSEIVIRKGDTLSGLSRKYSGKGSYYPQILLFNDIKNPNLIRTGDSIRVPLRKGKTVAETSANMKHGDKIKSAHPRPKTGNLPEAHSTAAETKIVVKTSSEDKSKSLIAATGSDEQKFFEQGAKAYRLGDCNAAIKFFENIIANYPSSSLAADASLYKADCLLKMSGQ